MTKTRKTLLALSLWSAMAVSALAQGTAFTYQGQLNSSGAPTSGNFDISFTLFSVSSGGSAIAGPVTNTAVSVTNGLFTTIVSFAGNPFTGATDFLELAVRTNGTTTFSPPLTPRQQLTPTPYAVFAESANASNLVGSVSAASLPANVALLGANQTFTGINDFSSSVGIGTATPQTPLEIRTPTDTRAALFSGPTGGGWSTLKTTGSGNPFLWDFRGDTNGYAASRSGMDVPFFVSYATGNTGIGTTTPANKLEVQGSADFTGAVGIGTNAPAAALQVVGTVGIGSPVNLSAELSIAQPGSVTQLELLKPGSNLGYQIATDANGLGICEHNVACGVFYIQNGTGNVGINTATPANLLDVQGSADFAGNVGIGTTTPTSTLAVNGNIFFGTERNNQVFNQIGDTLYLGAEQKYLGNTLLSPIGGSTDWINLMANPISAGIMFGTSGPSTTDPHSNITALVVIKPSGNVGIGTATPNSDSLLQVNGMVRMGSETGTSEAPTHPILVRRINSTSSASGQVVARGFAGAGRELTMTLERDGTTGGLVLKITGPAGSAPQIVGFAIGANGVTTNIFSTSLGNNSTTQIFTDAQRIGYCRLTFGDALNAADATTIELMRLVDSGLNNGVPWIGTVTSTVNQ